MKVIIQKLLLGLPSGETDAAVIFKATPGSRRWQHMAREGNDESIATEDNYTIILGSHRNTSLKLEKSGEMRALVCLASGSPFRFLAVLSYAAVLVV